MTRHELVIAALFVNITKTGAFWPRNVVNIAAFAKRMSVRPSVAYGLSAGTETGDPK